MWVLNNTYSFLDAIFHSKKPIVFKVDEINDCIRVLLKRPAVKLLQHVGTGITWVCYLVVTLWGEIFDELSDI